MGTTVDEVIAAHRAAGRSFEAAGLTSFMRAEGEGELIVLLHGLPSSSFLYRKVIGELAARGFAAMSFDLPGLGLADRPVGFDFTFAGLGRFAVAAVDALGLERFHLVVHDAGGPVGFELAASAPDRVRSLTILNTVVAMDAVPFPMEVYARWAAQRGWAALPPPRVSRALIYAIGISEREPEGRQPLIQVAAHGRRRDLGRGRCLGRRLVGPRRHRRSGPMPTSATSRPNAIAAGAVANLP
jgi:haloalkane dehalogenase